MKMRNGTGAGTRLLCLELALLLALAVTVLWGAWSLRRQEELESKLIRLHVVAHSDDPADQALKLRVRDRVLSAAEPLLAGAHTAQRAEERLRGALPELEAAARDELARRGCDLPVAVTLAEETFSRRDYGSFALPAGRYTALRVTIGAGEGHNWWCVVFPPLCTAACAELAEAAEAGGLDEDDVALITAEEPGYVLKFRSLELWEQLRRWLGKG